VNNTFIEGGGIDRVMFGLIDHVRKVHPVKVLVAESGFEVDYPNLRNLEIEVVKTKDTRHKVLWMLTTVRNRMLNETGIFHLHHAVLNWAALGNSRRNYLCTYHGWYSMALDPALAPKKIARAGFLGATTALYRRMHQVTTVSLTQKEELEGTYRVKDPTYIPNGVDTRSFTPTGEDEGYMLFVGRLIGQKRVEQLVQLAADIDMPLKIIGRGPQKDELMLLASKLGVELDIMTGLSEEDLIDTYRRAAFYATASGWEGMTLTILEACACGKPVLAYDVVSNRDVVVDGSTGLLAKDYEGLVKYGRTLKDDEGLRQEFGKHARQRVEERFTWDAIADQYLTIYAKIAEDLE